MNTRNDSERTERLKAALRDNLRRRKAQGRGRAETQAGAEGTGPSGRRDAGTEPGERS
ncbi:hypothetical protein [Methylobacterium oxalidis]|nr:hypothetical protein [Methylobacterium oxalidis]GJE32642.1 hypothetical protein LDDCCGHA_2830 [Methylobacterium oxalidis]